MFVPPEGEDAALSVMVKPFTVFPAPVFAFLKLRLARLVPEVLKDVSVTAKIEPAVAVEVRVKPAKVGVEAVAIS